MEINDEYIISVLWPNKIQLLSRCKDRLTPEIEQYLKTRFKKSESLYESLYCIKHNIDRDKIVCPICGVGDVHFTGSKSRGLFTHGCCSECQIKYRNQHSIQTCLERYGTKHPTQNKEKNAEIIELRKKHNLEKYGVEAYTQTEEYKAKLKKTSLEKYGTEHPFQSEIVKNKIHQTCKERYGTDWIFQNDLAKQRQQETLLKKYGVTNSYCIPDVIASLKERKDEIQQKRDNTKRLRKTFGSSIPENKTYKKLCCVFGINNILREYKEERYPFKCDFYIKTLDLFIECNYFWTHENHFFDKNNVEDIKKLNVLIERAKTSTFYQGIITTWTERDVLKRETAEKNDLNYLVFWNYIEFENWLKDYETKNS